MGEQRSQVRRRLDEAIERPLDREAAEEYDRENWGTSPEAIAAAEEADLHFPETG